MALRPPERTVERVRDPVQQPARPHTASRRPHSEQGPRLRRTLSHTCPHCACVAPSCEGNQPVGRTWNLRHRAQGMLCFLVTLRFKAQFSAAQSVASHGRGARSEAFFGKDAAVVSDDRDGVSVRAITRTEMVSSMKM